MEVPGDKSISHRALLVAALARGTSTIHGLNRGIDVGRTRRVIAQLGAPVARDPNGIVKIEGYGYEGLGEAEDVLDAGNSGTTLRAALGICAALRGLFLLTGDASLRRRPMGRVVDPLRAMGASIEGRSGGAFAPLAVRGGELTGIDVELDVASAQTKTALLLAGLNATGTTRVTEPCQSRDHTERMLIASGVPLRTNRTTTSVARHREVRPLEHRIPGDISSAVFLLAAATVVPGSHLILARVGLNPTRIASLDALARMGARLEWEVAEEWCGEPSGSVRASHSQLTGTVIEGQEIPKLIDEIPMLAVLASQADGVTIVRDAAELRVKESDRIEAVVEGLLALGADAEALPDGLVIRGPTPLRGGVVDSRGDHRIALAFAVAGLIAKGGVEIEEWDCVDTSFPEFLDLLHRAQGLT